MQHENNTFAKNVKGEPVHISEITSGRKGYFCLGCEAQMEARKGHIRQHHFAHIPKEVGEVRKCSYSDETYRHKLAKNILLKLKAVKVPALYKYPEDIISGTPNLLSKAKIITAHKADDEVAVHEDETGKIVFNKTHGKTDEKHLWIQPDVVFYDKHSKPILFIEIVATHKIDDHKLAKLRRIGIDTISITIPSGSPQQIEEVFYNTSRTEWIYNNEREKATYVPVSSANSEGISPTDEFQKKLLKAEKSFSCRSSEIGNLIRSIKKCLESEQYRKSEHELRSEINRTEGNTSRNRYQLSELQREIREQIETRSELEETGFTRSAKEFRESKDRFEEEYSEWEERYNKLERRYSQKRNEIERSIESHRLRGSTEITELEEEYADLNRKLEESRVETTDIRDVIREEEIKIEETRSQIDQFKEHSREFEEGRSRRNLELRSEIEKKFKGIRMESEERSEELYRSAREEFAGKERDQRTKFDKLRATTILAYDERDYTKSTRFRKRIKELVEARENFFTIEKEKSTISRYRKAKELLDKKVYLNWNKS